VIIGKKDIGIEKILKAIKNFENGKKWKDKHPKDISLREFMTNFTKSWKFSPAGSQVFPYFIPTFRYVVHKGKPRYVEYCKNLLLQDKPGSYLDNVGKDFESCEMELKYFVENSPFCPQLVKDEFAESQGVVEVTDDADPFTKVDDLYLQAEKIPDNIPRDETIQVYAGDFEEIPTIDPNVEGFDDAYEYNDEIIAKYNSDDTIDWNEDAEVLNLSTNDMLEAQNWLKRMKSLVGDDIEDLDGFESFEIANKHIKEKRTS